MEYPFTEIELLQACWPHWLLDSSESVNRSWKISKLLQVLVVEHPEPPAAHEHRGLGELLCLDLAWSRSTCHWLLEIPNPFPRRRRDFRLAIGTAAGSASRNGFAQRGPLWGGCHWSETSLAHPEQRNSSAHCPAVAVGLGNIPWDPGWGVGPASAFPVSCSRAASTQWWAQSCQSWWDSTAGQKGFIKQRAVLVKSEWFCQNTNLGGFYFALIKERYSFQKAASSVNQDLNLTLFLVMQEVQTKKNYG